MNLGCGCDPCYRGSPNQETIPTLDVLPGAGAVHPVGKGKDGATHSPSHRTSDPPPSAARHAPMALIEAYEDQCALAQTAGQEGQDTRSGDGGWMAGWMPQWPGLDAYHPPALVGQAGTLQTLSPGAARPRPVDAATVDAPDDRPIGDNSTVALPGGDGATPQNQANLERGADTRDIDATLEVRPLQAIQVESPSVRPLPVRLQEIPVETPKSPVRTSAHEDPPPSMPLQVSSRGRERLNRSPASCTHKAHARAGVSVALVCEHGLPGPTFCCWRVQNCGETKMCVYTHTFTFTHSHARARSLSHTHKRTYAQNGKLQRFAGGQPFQHRPKEKESR